MANSQPYHSHSLSYALNPHPPTYASNNIYTVKQSMSAVQATRQEEEDDEGAVEEQLNEQDHENTGSSNPSPMSNTQESSKQEQTQAETTPSEPEQKRRPGRPRGSKNRKSSLLAGQTPGQQTLDLQAQAQTQPVAGPSTAPPPHHPDVNPQNKEYYELQWRVLNLCAEFYAAAEELIKGTKPLVLAQCFQMSASNVDPIVMIREAKQRCDALIANPSRLITNPPPPLYHVVPQFYQPPIPQPVAPVPSANSAPVINQPQSFVVPMAAPGQYAYAPASYYPYAGYQVPTGQPYYPPPPAQVQQPSAQPPPSSSASNTKAAPQTPQSSTVSSPPIIQQGPWSDEEVERLKKLVKDAKGAGHSGDAAWNYVVDQWGSSRRRQQILMKLTQLGLKESSTRNLKRRRDATEEVSSPRILQPPGPSQTGSGSTAGVSSSSPSNSTPGASPLLPHQTSQQSQSATPAPAAAPQTSAKPAWPMPTVAANTPSPIVAAASSSSSSTSYYRPRPSGETPSKSTTAGAVHQYMYQPNGSSRK